VAESLLLLVAWLACRWLFFLLFIRLMQGSITVNILIATASHSQLSSHLHTIPSLLSTDLIATASHPQLSSHLHTIPISSYPV
jgi:hypothetical protein